MRNALRDPSFLTPERSSRSNIILRLTWTLEKHHVVGQVLFALSREVSDVGKEDGELKLLSFSGSYPMQLVEVQDNDILWIIKEPADNHGAVNLCLARKARELVPSPLVYNFLLDRVPRRDVRDPIQDLDTTGCAAPSAATLVEGGIDSFTSTRRPKSWR